MAGLVGVTGDCTMSTTDSATGWDRRLASARRVVSLVERCWDALQKQRRRERICADLSNLNDRELMDIGIARGEIDYVAANDGIDPRGIRSIPPMNV
jgi:uncharacterized protein YjiS (DUF1127 family)